MDERDADAAALLRLRLEQTLDVIAGIAGSMEDLQRSVSELAAIQSGLVQRLAALERDITDPG